MALLCFCTRVRIKEAWNLPIPLLNFLREVSLKVWNNISFSSNFLCFKFPKFWIALGSYLHCWIYEMQINQILIILLFLFGGPLIKHDLSLGYLLLAPLPFLNINEFNCVYWFLVFTSYLWESTPLWSFTKKLSKFSLDN